MGDTMIVNFAALHTASGHISEAIARLQGELSDLERSAAPLVATWEGDARQAYEQRQTTWRRAAADLSTMLAEIKRAVDDSAADYAATERRNASLFH
jgi:WXG100 family type VII secretion target